MMIRVFGFFIKPKQLTASYRLHGILCGLFQCMIIHVENDHAQSHGVGGAKTADSQILFAPACDVGAPSIASKPSIASARSACDRLSAVLFGTAAALLRATTPASRGNDSPRSTDRASSGVGDAVSPVLLFTTPAIRRARRPVDGEPAPP